VGDSREFQLETRHLTFLVFLVVALCVASFLLGRWVERQSLGPTVAALAGASGAGTVDEMGDVAEELTFFDSLKNNKPVPLEPEPAGTSGDLRPVAGDAGRRVSATGTGSRSVEEGIMVQVLASKQRKPADELRRRLRSKGYTALLLREGGTYKVRVGPYADREEAERAAEILRKQEDVTTWIP
jgi:hypothetical protein